MSLFKNLFKSEYDSYDVNGYHCGIAADSQSSAEEYIKNMADVRYSNLLNQSIEYNENLYTIIQIPEKINDYTFKIKYNDIQDVLSMKDYEQLIVFNNFKSKKGITGTHTELKDKFKVFLAFNDGWSDKIGYTPERLRVVYELWLLNKNLSISTLIRNNKDLLMEADKNYFNI